MNNDDDEYELVFGETTTTTVTFSLAAEDLLPDEVSQLLGVEPSRSWRKGDHIPKRASSTFTPRQTYPFGRWLLDAPCTKYEPYDEQLHRLLEVLETLPSVLGSLIESYQGEIIIALASEEYHAGFHFDRNLMRRLHHLGVALEVVVYLGE